MAGLNSGSVAGGAVGSSKPLADCGHLGECGPYLPLGLEQEQSAIVADLDPDA